MTNKQNYNQQQTIGGWKLNARLGEGHNGEVWRAHKQDQVDAIKLMRNINFSRYERGLRREDSA